MMAMRTTKWALAVLLAAGTAWAQGPGDVRGMGPGNDRGGPSFGGHRPPMEEALGPRGAHGRWWNDPGLVEKLKLTDEQRKAMDAILLDHREKLIDQRAAVEKAEIEMEPLLRDDQPNEGKILSQIDKVAQARAELEKANARFLLAIRSKLSPEQWKQLQAARSEGREDRMRHRMGQGGPMMRRQGAPEPPAGGPGPQGMAGEGPDGPSMPGDTPDSAQ